jgi:hypothetical protein
MLRIGLAAPPMAVVASTLLAGCVSDFSRSHVRWRGYAEGSGPYSQWARCIRDRSYHHHDPDGTGLVATGAGTFTQVLADCRELMTGPAWTNLPDQRTRQLLNDAYQAFLSAGADLMARQEASIT